MIIENGKYEVRVCGGMNTTYLTNGLYDVEIRTAKRPHESTARFVNVKTGGSTWERLSMMKLFEESGRVICTKAN